VRAKTLKGIRNNQPFLWFSPTTWVAIITFIGSEALLFEFELWELMPLPVLVGAYLAFWEHFGPKDKRRLKFGRGEKPIPYWTKRINRKLRANRYVRGEVRSYFEQRK